MTTREPPPELEILAAQSALVAPDSTGLVGGVVPAPQGRELRPRAEPAAVLVLRFSALGDVILLTPALDALRAAWPKTRIVVAVGASAAPILAHDPNVSGIVALAPGEGTFAYTRRLRAALPESGPIALLDLHGKLRSLAIRALLPFDGPRVVWHKRDVLDTVGVKLRLRTWRSDRLHADRYHLAVEQLVGRPLPRGRLRCVVAPEEVDRAAGLLAAAGRDLAKPLVGLSPGAKWATKRWPAERFAALARRALAAGCDVAVQGSPDERALCAEIVAQAPGSLDLSGNVDIPTLMGLVHECTAFIANDSGPMHLARALGVPTLAIFGSTDPGMFAWTGHRALFAGLPCAPCSFYGRDACPLGHLRCLLDIEVEAAWTALEALLAAGPVGAVGA